VKSDIHSINLPLPVTKAAESLGYASPKTFLQMARREGLPLIQISPARVAIDPEDFAAFCEARKHKPELKTKAQ
jgi:hypothetical protein